MDKVRGRIVKVGNSYGFRVPKVILDTSDLIDEVFFEVIEANLVISPAHHPRAGWAEAFKQMAERGDDTLLDDPDYNLSEWDEEEWEW